MKMHSDKVQGENEKKEADKKMQELNAACNLLLDELEKPPKMPLSPEEQKRREESTMRYLKDRFGSHLCPEGSRRVLYLFAALEDERFEEAKCLLLVKREDRRDKYVENINKKERPQNGDEDKALLHYLTQSACNNPIVEMVESDCNNLSVGKAYRNLGRNWQALFKETLQKRRGTDNAVETNISDKYGVTPMHIAARHGRTDLMTILIDHGADVNVLDNAQRSPLDEAADKNYVKAVKFLLDNKDVTISKNVRTNVDQKKYSPEMIAMFLDHPSFKTKNQITAESCKGNATNPVTLKPTPKPTIIPGSTLNHDQSNGQGSSSPQELIEFLKLHKEFMKIRKPSDLEKRLFGLTTNFEDKGLENLKNEEREGLKDPENLKNLEGLKEKLNQRNNVIDERTFAAHGTNAVALFSAFAFTNGQLLSQHEMKVIVGAPAVVGERIYEKARRAKGDACPNTINQHYVSTVALYKKDSFLDGTIAYSDSAINRYQYKYDVFKKTYLAKYEGRDAGAEFLAKANELFNNEGLREAYEKLSRIPVVILGDRIGGYNNDNGESGIINEHVGIRLNARVLILYERDIGYVQGLISTINPKLAEDITYISREKIEEFQKQREQCNTNYGIQGKNSFVYDFSQKFGDQLTFEFSGRFKQKQVKIPTLLKTRIGGAYALNVDTTYYYQNPNQISEDITVFQTDYTAFTKPIQSNSDDKQKISLTRGALHTIAGNTTQHKRTPVVSNSNINGNFSPTVQSSQPPVVHNQNSSPKKTTTLKPTPGPTIIPGSTFNGNQNGNPKSTATSQTSMITQSSSSDNSQSNNNTRSLLIGLAIAGAIIGAVALYFFAPLILGVSVGVGAKLGLGIVGAGAGAAIGRGIGCLTDVAISCCSSKAHAA